MLSLVLAAHHLTLELKPSSIWDPTVTTRKIFTGKTSRSDFPYASSGMQSLLRRVWWSVYLSGYASDWAALFTLLVLLLWYAPQPERSYCLSRSSFLEFLNLLFVWQLLLHLREDGYTCI